MNILPACCVVTFGSNLSFEKVTIVSCCRKYDMKKLVVDCNVSQCLVDYVLYNHIKAMFNIYPNKIVGLVIELSSSEGKFWEKVCGELESVVVQEFEIFFSNIETLHNRIPISVNSERTKHTSIVRNHFKLNERNFWDKIIHISDTVGVDVWILTIVYKELAMTVLRESLRETEQILVDGSFS